MIAWERRDESPTTVPVLACHGETVIEATQNRQRTSRLAWKER